MTAPYRLLRADRNGDPCICGDKTTWHPACYARIQPGFKVRNEHGEARFLTDIEKQTYVVLRRKGCVPFVVGMRDYFRDWTPV